MENGSHIGQNVDPEISTQIKYDGAQISIGQVSNIIVGNNSKIVVTSKSSQKRKVIAAQHPLTTSEQPLNLNQKLDIKDNVGKQWKDLGRQLGFCDAELEQLEMENSDNYSEVVYQILLKWEQRATHQATQRVIAAVFQKMGRGDLSDRLSDQNSP